MRSSCARPSITLTARGKSSLARFCRRLRVRRVFKAGYWTWPTGEGELNVLAMIIFDSEENARAAGDRVSANFSQLENRDDVTLDGVEVREVVAST